MESVAVEINGLEDSDDDDGGVEIIYFFLVALFILNGFCHRTEYTTRCIVVLLLGMGV